ncbi:Peroxin-3 [Backusella circina FSU 941]|nr:Peroxin-3 [Backusella circina FSU 941]
MTLIRSVKDYAKRHQQGLTMTAVVVGGTLLAGQYAAYKWREAQQEATAERLAKENLKRRFQQNQKDCIFTVKMLLNTLGEEVLEEFDVETAWRRLQTSRTLERGRSMESSIESLDSASISSADDALLPMGVLNKKEKQLIWEEIKIKSFTRALTCIYSATLLTLLTHIQVNLLGRFTYIWSVSTLDLSETGIRFQQERNESVPHLGFLDPQTERMFLSASWWLVHHGWKGIAEKVQEAVEEIVTSIPLKSTLNYQEADALIQRLRNRIEYRKDAKPTSYRSWMLPDSKLEEIEFMRGAGFGDDYSYNHSATISLSKLLNETRDFIDSPDFQDVLRSCLDEQFEVFDRHVFFNMLMPLPSTVEQGIGEGRKSTFANLLPNISRQAHSVVSGNEYLDTFSYIKELQAFSALIYTQYGDIL